MTDASQDNLVVVFEQIKQIGREFRLQYKSGKLPRIENWLKKIPESGRENLFQNLLQQEIIYCRAEGQHPTSAPYIRRFPQYQKLIRQAFFESTQMSVTGESPSTPSKISASVGAATMEYEDIARIGDYELLCQLGQGGFGVVYQARHAQRQNIVALKVLPSGFEGEAVNADRLLRFRREFRTLSEFSHPNLVGMQSLEVDDGKWFFTMDLIDGTDFLTWVRPYDELNVRRLRDALSQLARGILALHERNIVHRDLKPGNVMVEADGTVKILDFGLVAELQGVTDQTASLRSAQFAGTPKYAAPEQMFGERSEASDWYALGVMLYEALTGEAPFAGNQMEILQKKQSQDPALLFGREGIPEDLAQLADALLRRKSEDRLTATDIVDKLQLDLETRVIGSTRAGQDSGGSAGSMDQEEFFGLQDQGEQGGELIGRENQLQHLQKAFEEFLAEKEPFILFVRGLSGEGKSSLVHKFLSPIRQGKEMLVLSGRCYDRESVPFKAIDSVIEPLARFLRSKNDDELQDLLPQDIQFLAYLFPLLKRVRKIAEIPSEGIAGMDALKLKSRAFAAFQDLLNNLSVNYPVLLMIDDLQWGDPDSAGVLSDLFRSTNAPPVLFLGSYRSDEAAESPFLRNWKPLEQESELKTYLVEVGPLDLEQCLQLAQQRTGMDESLVRPHAEALFEQSGGNPYLVEQLAEGIDRETGEFKQLPLKDMIYSRLGKLPYQATTLLKLIAASGQPILINELSEAAGFDTPDLGTLTHMRSERLVRLTGSGDQITVDTYHDKIRENILQNISLNQKKKLHLILGETIEKKEGLDVDSLLNNMSTDANPGVSTGNISNRVFDAAHHFLQAEEDRKKAFVYLLLAGERSLMAYAFGDAVEYYQHAEPLVPENSPTTLQFRLWYGMGRVLLCDNKVDQAIARFRSALNIAPDSLARSRACVGLGNVFRQLAQFDESIKHFDDALMHLGNGRPKTTIGRMISAFDKSLRVLLVPAVWQSRQNEKDRIIARLRHDVLMSHNLIMYEKDFLAWVDAMNRSALATFQTGEHRFIAVGYAEAAFFWSVVGIHWFGRMFVRRAASIDVEQNDPDTRGVKLEFQGYGLYWEGDLEDSEKFFQEAIPLLQRCGNIPELLTAQHMIRHCIAYRGTTTAELSAARNVREVATTFNDQRAICWGNYDTACALARRGSLPDAAMHMSNANSGLASEAYHMTEAIRGSADGYFRLQCSDFRGAKRVSNFAWNVVAKFWVANDVTLLGLPILIESIADANWLESSNQIDTRLLKKILRRANFLYYTIPNHQPHLQRVFGRAAAAMGKKKKAIRYFHKAIKLAEKKGMDYQRGKSLLDLAAVQEENREANRAEGIELLKKMESVIPRAESWLLGDQYDEAVVAPEFDLAAWEAENGPVTPYLSEIKNQTGSTG